MLTHSRVVSDVMPILSINVEKYEKKKYLNLVLAASIFVKFFKNINEFEINNSNKNNFKNIE
jgi:hypothetical protein